MSSRAAAQRVPVLVAVLAAHAGVLLVLLVETRTRRVDIEPDVIPILVMPPQARAPLAAGSGAAPARPQAPRSSLPPEAEPGVSASATSADSITIDWAAEARASATRQIEGDEQHARQARALVPRPSPIFAAPRRPTPGIHWNYAAMHRVQPLGGLATVINLNDNCAVVLFIIVPFAGGCTLDKIPARGDLFEHMHDPEPGPLP